MEMSYYEIDGLMVMILKVFGEYEYYVRDGSDDTDVFKFAFGCYEEFSEEELMDMSDYLWSYQEGQTL